MPDNKDYILNIRVSKELYEKLEGERSHPATRKKEFLSTVLKRAVTRLNQTEGV